MILFAGKLLAAVDVLSSTHISQLISQLKYRIRVKRVKRFDRKNKMFSRRSCWYVAGQALLVLSSLSLFAQSSRRVTVYIPYTDAKPVIQALAEILPVELRGKSDQEIAALWSGWVILRDQEIRSRLAQGDEDSLINFILFGTSFTREPRLSLQQVASLATTPSAYSSEDAASISRISTLVKARIRDFLSALARPTRNERILFAQDVLIKQKGLRLESRQSREQAAQYLQAAFDRILKENAGYSRVLESARLQGDATEEFAERSRLFRARGLASDTSILPNFAIEESLKVIKERRLLTPGAVRRVAVIGPGLDFADKQEGYDFYPVQTIQPFAIIDTLLRLKLATASELHVTTMDLSPRVNDHIARATQSAKLGKSYVVQLPRDVSAPWKPELVAYWERFGDQIGVQVAGIAIPSSASDIKIRAVRIQPSVVSRISPSDTNIVLQNLDLRPADKFDLIIGTNIFVYYDNLDQSLAMMNIQKMLRPGGLMLSNNALLELPFFRVRSAGYSTVVFSDRPDDGDHIVWYQRLPDPQGRLRIRVSQNSVRISSPPTLVSRH
jgi:hypothetical protein